MTAQTEAPAATGTDPALTALIAARAATDRDALREPEQAALPLGRQIIELTPNLRAALPAHLRPDAERMTRIALTAIRADERLSLCSANSIVGALMTCAQLGLEPGAADEAYLSPGRDLQCRFVLGYKGMIKLFWQHQLAKSITAQVVYEGDRFRHAYALPDSIFEHEPTLGPRGERLVWYAMASYTNGGGGFNVLRPDDVERHRAWSDRRYEGPWITSYDAMAKKSAMRELFVWLPKSRDLARALARDGQVRTDLDPDMLDAPVEDEDPPPGEPRPDPEVDGAAGPDERTPVTAAG